MSELSIRTLTTAFGSLIADRERILERIDREPREVDEEEHLSELVMDIDQALGEIADAYESQRNTASGYPPYTELVANIQHS
jgi:hypothetical protein